VDPDNDQSVGFVLKFGKFDFLDLGDLTWNYEPKLVCPSNLIGKIDLFQTSHHGLDRSNSPQLLTAIKPTVAVMNDGPHKGGPASVFETLRKVGGVQDIWQKHRALDTPKEINAPDDRQFRGQCRLQRQPSDGVRGGQRQIHHYEFAEWFFEILPGEVNLSC